MSRKAKKQFGSDAPTHHRRARMFLVNARALAKTATSQAKRGQCESALRALTTATLLLGNSQAERHGEGKRSQYAGGVRLMTHLRDRVAGCYRKEKIKAALRRLK